MQFREAFSCFVFSEQEPKGIDCVEKFKAMQDCFREHPDVYAEGTFPVFAGNESSSLFPIELDEGDDDDPNAATEPSEAPVLTTADGAPLDQSIPTKVHTEPSSS